MSNLDRTFLEQWMLYERIAFATDAQATERVGARRAFYAGAAAILALLARVDKTTPDEAATEYLERLQRELRAFAELVANGSA
jgi:hypothetical protein